MSLLRQWRAGDRQAGDVLIRRHYAYALGLARRRLANGDDAVEATQHAMAILVQKQEVIEEDFRQYLGRVVYFSVLTQTKRRRHKPLRNEEAAAAPARGASTALAQKEEEKLMIKALRSLPIDDQLVFYYEFVGERTRTEIAELLGLPPKGIYRRVHAAKKRLEARLRTFRDSPVRQNTLGGLETWLRSMHQKAQVDGGG
ncbi:RNA polymerase sigma factor [Paraliomyxa miuraensis]|uniref:RNA polymerase sigma factor n=1 Tax=Paraliomyxa miuraensis TaxID=376150 RepID=UPI002259F25B|nr:sigma-70 family RNA polymerase sigma factor [Paraliomyxa miuraensis]